MNNCVAPLTNSQFGHCVAEQGDAVIALHCSGGNARQWRGLGQALGGNYEMLTPEHFGTSVENKWPEDKILSLADEAAQSLELIDQTNKNVHLVGHSYGGALALHIALARPERISSVSLYEPCAFHLLPKLGVLAAAEMSEIAALAASILQSTGEGDNWSAMQGFVDYWNGEGAWTGMKSEYREQLMRWAPNAVNAFDALFTENTALSDYQGLNVPVQLLQGGKSPDPVRMVSTALSRLLPECRTNRLPGVGHMGPLTHADIVNGIITAHIESNSNNSNFQLSENSVLVERVAVAA